MIVLRALEKVIVYICKAIWREIDKATRFVDSVSSEVVVGIMMKRK